MKLLRQTKNGVALLICFLQIVTVFPLSGQDSLVIYATNIPAVSFRGLSVVNDSIIWASGTGGTVCRSTDGGHTFNCQIVSGYDSADFRTIYAFDNQTVLIANTGSPAVILRTADGGRNWKKVYENHHPDAFINGMDFHNALQGLCYGDPADALMLLMRTDDGGQTWYLMNTASRPLLVDGEYSFAASGTGIRCFAGGKVMISTGGEISRILYSLNFGQTWNSMITPMLKGEKTTGIFSFDFINDLNGVIVGGDYLRDTLSENHVFYTGDGGKTWLSPLAATRGYRECVQYLSADSVVAVGPTGIDISTDGGKNWRPFSNERGLHVVQLAMNGRRIIVAGSKGKLGMIRMR